MVLRSIPVTRSIWRWLLPASNSVAIVVCRCGFKTFNPVSLKSEGVTVTSCQGLTEAMKNGVRPPSHQGRGGGIWGGHKWGSLGGHQGPRCANALSAWCSNTEASTHPCGPPLSPLPPRSGACRKPSTTGFASTKLTQAFAMASALTSEPASKTHRIGQRQPSSSASWGGGVAMDGELARSV